MRCQIVGTEAVLFFFSRTSSGHLMDWLLKLGLQQNGMQMSPCTRRFVFHQPSQCVVFISPALFLVSCQFLQTSFGHPAHACFILSVMEVLAILKGLRKLHSYHLSVGRCWKAKLLLLPALCHACLHALVECSKMEVSLLQSLMC